MGLAWTWLVCSISGLQLGSLTCFDFNSRAHCFDSIQTAYLYWSQLIFWLHCYLPQLQDMSPICFSFNPCCLLLWFRFILPIYSDFIHAAYCLDYISDCLLVLILIQITYQISFHVIYCFDFSSWSPTCFEFNSCMFHQSSILISIYVPDIPSALNARSDFNMLLIKSVFYQYAFCSSPDMYLKDVCQTRCWSYLWQQNVCYNLMVLYCEITL